MGTSLPAQEAQRKRAGLHSDTCPRLPDNKYSFHLSLQERLCGVFSIVASVLMNSFSLLLARAGVGTAELSG